MKNSVTPFSFTQTLNAYQHDLQNRARKRWFYSFLGVISGSSILTCAIIYWPHNPVTAIAAPPPATIALDLAPLPASIPAPPTEKPLGPPQKQAVTEPAPETPPKISAPSSPAPHPPALVPKPSKIRKPARKHKPLPKTKALPEEKTPPSDKTTAPAPSDAPPSPQQASPRSAVSSARQFHSVSSWQSALLAQLEKFKRYPSEAMNDHQEGVPLIRFSMDRQGHVLSVNLSKKSDYRLLNEEALHLPQRAQPLPPPPDNIKGDVITLTVPIEFTLRRN